MSIRVALEGKEAGVGRRVTVGNPDCRLMGSGPACRNIVYGL
ncbi:MAG: hypothetical protein OXN97_14090 [Bryobacterales bacterium]|nr:hypothetical protein [Bryobacterales bacterium]